MFIYLQKAACLEIELSLSRCTVINMHNDSRLRDAAIKYPDLRPILTLTATHSLGC